MKYFYQITNFRISFKFKENLKEHLAAHLEVPVDHLVDFHILKESLDARQNRKDIFYQYKIIFSIIAPIQNLEEKKNIEAIAPPIEFTKTLSPNKIKYLGPPPIIIGFGPAGMFAAYILVKAGVKPIIIEKGQTVDDRQKTLNQLWKNSVLNTESNVQFGEGGAGFFSDGKLGTRVNSDLIPEVYKIFVEFGAKPEILYENKPHLGTDKLKDILKNFRTYLIENGAEFYFNTTVNELLIDKNRHIQGVKTADGKEFLSNIVFLCAGHSSRKIYRMLHEKGVSLESKDFAVGFRIEHPQSFVNICQYGSLYDNPALPAAAYKLQNHNYKDNTGTYSFCMCPGGMVMLATSEEGKIVTNGMSLSRRDGKFANAGIVVGVNKEIFGEGLFAGIEFQEMIEAKAFAMSGSYFAPAQRVTDFIENRLTENLPKSSFLPGIVSRNLRDLYPERINEQIIEAMKIFNQKMKGFIHKDAIFIAPETRTSSPLRILRNETTMVSVNTPGLIPLGEGAGAAGGITSASIEGINGAMAWLKQQN